MLSIWMVDWIWRCASCSGSKESVASHCSKASDLGEHHVTDLEADA